MLRPFPHSTEGTRFNQPIHFNNEVRDWFTQIRDEVNLGPNPADQDLSATDSILPVSQLIRVQSATSGNVTLTSNPQIENGDDGQTITLEGLDNTKTVTISSGNGLELETSPTVLKQGSIINLHYNAARNIWIENYRSLK